MDQYISPDYPNLIFSTVEAAKSFAEKLDFEEYKVAEYLFLSNDEKQTTLIGYVILINERLFQ
jgi:hypothetical protein